ncbi:fumarylacetoacetate hydrolase family protein [Caldimonas thermodepolymerans]|jgi:2-keto-4-pentenoate hydratase/2-oxohepta-3-ene-1,7-dioic acid hydratase (catechol pathway)|uniref:2-keto-4-pentenoate hydratase n=1 Tax=Caldimonas thermodepolymerans TaxID=215580 RepID=A0A2S5T5T1_9BURK|nr:fumarylacetoacetate hydrolase family protein [Caldimonas thermodepolymerans]PPE70302.1 2-keto-4-pentenoate hydratase [Caldimonas thermodepolymerans]QPC30212.1 fumarylacetoacetate hydrolase family protein [Caldimonas thermodepolymerans]RDI00597.1 fumarylacetoacetate (FAA) hydrolase [Caldimonas thermodepolymerans]TCP07124.1 fumarylacetoacetate (FAA) hydrolase [Caldimonas thermodepolymerans]UZG42970.1 fumarylacetoacetate hydrolase family protein [Caldimonas thermodepolymerans]
MILATLDNGSRDGELLVVDRERRRAVSAKDVVPTLQAALDDWDACAGDLQALSDALNAGRVAQAFDLARVKLVAPLPRPFAFYDTAAYPEHISVIRQARGATLPADFHERPLMYQSVAAPMMAPDAPIVVDDDASLGVDLEAEIVAIVSDVAPGTTADEAAGKIRLLGLINDVSLRHLVAPELARGFGFLQSKPESAMGPFVVTPDELGPLWNGRMFTGGSYRIHVRGQWLGDLDPGQDVIFDYAQLVAYAARTRHIVAGSLFAAGTLANKDRRHGSGCIAEQRAREQITEGAPRTELLRFGDEVHLEMFDAEGRSVFGAIRQRLQRRTG